MNKLHFSFLTFLFSLFVAPSCLAQKTGCIQLYSDADYQIMCISPNGKWACGIKQNAYEESGHGFRWNLTTDKIDLISESSEANKISDDGVVAGGYYKRVNGKNVERAGLWDGEWTDLDVPADANETWATAITPDGRYICGCNYTNAGKYVGYVWNSDGSILRKLEYIYTSMPTCISPDGSVVGGWIMPYNRVPGWWTVSDGNWNYVDESLKGGPWFQVKKIYSSNKDFFYYGGYVQNTERKDSIWGLKSFFHADTRKSDFIYPVAESTPYSFEMFDTDAEGNIAVGYEQALDSSDLAVVWEKGAENCTYMEDWLKAHGADFDDYDIVLADTEENRHYLCRCVCVSEDGKKFGLDYYDNDYNVRTMIVMLDQNIYHNCPLNPEASQVTGLDVVHITWYTPLGDKSNLTGYDVYRNGVKVGTQEPTSNEVQEFYDKDVPTGSYTYTLKAVYSDGESEFSETAAVDVAERAVQVPQSLTARQRGYNSALYMWAQPKSNMIPCSYVEDGKEMNSLGGGNVSFETGVLFDAATMELYKGYMLTAVSFMPRSHQGSWVVNVYTHQDGKLKKLYATTVSDDNLNIGEFNIIRLPKQVKIPEGQDMIIGVQTNVTTSSYNVQGFYENCLTIGKTDLMRQVGESDFYSLNEASSTSYDVSWATTALFALDGATEDVDAIDHYNVYADDTKLGETTDLRYVDASLADGNHTMAVDVVYQNGKQSEKVAADFTVKASANNLPAIVPAVTTYRQTMDASWATPTDCDPSVMGWCSDVNGSKMPSATEDVPSFIARVDFYDEEHRAYDNYQIQSLSFKPMSDSRFTLYVFENDEQVCEVEPADIVIGSWNTVQLEEPITINKGCYYTFEVACEKCPAGEAPLATDANDAENDHSDLYCLPDEGTWYNITEFNASGNWMMRMNVVDPEGAALDATYDVLLDGTKECSQSDLSYSKTYADDDPGDHNIQVNTVYTIDGKQVTRKGEPVEFHLSTSGIEEISNEQSAMNNCDMFNLAGQRINSARYNGLVIKNNKKVVVK